MTLPATDGIHEVNISPTRMVPDAPTHAALAVRISEDQVSVKAMDNASINRQVRMLIDHFTGLGWRIRYLIIEFDVSATALVAQTYRPNGRPIERTERPYFQESLDMIYEGKFDAFGIEHPDRMFRFQVDLTDMVNAYNRCPTPIVTASRTGSFDISTDMGIAAAEFQCTFSGQESRSTKRRVTGGKRFLAEQGRFLGGARPFGYRLTEPGEFSKDEDPTLVIDKSRPEAEWARWAADEVEAGMTLRSIERAMAAEGIKTDVRRYRKDGKQRAVRKGKQYGGTVPNMRQILLNPTIAGLSHHCPVGSKEKDPRKTIVCEARWEPIIERAQWERVVAKLLDGSRDSRNGGDSKPRHWGSNTYECWKCGPEKATIQGLSPQSSNRGNGRPNYDVYICRQCHGVSRRKDLVDEVVEEAMLDILVNPESESLVERRKNSKADLKKLYREKERIEVDLDNIAEERARGKITGRMLDTMSRVLMEMLTGKEIEIANAQSPDDPAKGIAGKHNAAELWDDITFERQRAIIRSWLRVVILPKPPGPMPRGVEINAESFGVEIIMKRGNGSRKKPAPIVVMEQECPCGTYRGSAWHQRHGEKPCEACRTARNEYFREWRAATGRTSHSSGQRKAGMA